MMSMGTWRKPIARAGFTLMELLVTIAIIAMLAAILLPALNSAFRKAEQAQARQEVKAIETAVKAYFNEYSKYPHANDPSSQWDWPYYTSLNPNSELMNVLRSIKDDGNTDHENNPRQIIFLEVSEKSLDENGNFLDPWDQQYRIMTDINFNNQIDMLGGGTTVEGRNVAVWSTGPDTVEDSADDIKSWE